MDATCFKEHKPYLAIEYKVDKNKKLITCGHVKCTHPECITKYNTEVKNLFYCKMCDNKKLALRRMNNVNVNNLTDTCVMCKQSYSCLWILANRLIVKSSILEKYKDCDLHKYPNSILTLAPPQLHSSMVLDEAGYSDSEGGVASDDVEVKDNGDSYFTTMRTMVCTHTVCDSCLSAANETNSSKISSNCPNFKMCPVAGCYGFGSLQERVVPVPRCSGCKQVIPPDHEIGNRCTSKCSTMFCENCFKDGICTKNHSYTMGVCSDVMCETPRTRRSRSSVRVVECSECRNAYCDIHADKNGILILSVHHVVYHCNRCVASKKREKCTFTQMERDGVIFYKITASRRYKRNREDAGEFYTGSSSSDGDDDDEEHAVVKRSDVKYGPMDLYLSGTRQQGADMPEENNSKEDDSDKEWIETIDDDEEEDEDEEEEEEEVESGDEGEDTDDTSDEDGRYSGSDENGSDLFEDGYVSE